MRDDELIQKTEDYVKQVFTGIEGRLLVAHDFNHVDRVRNWALTLASCEGYDELEMLEVTALLHDIGLIHMSDGDERIGHGEIGAQMAEEFLKNNSSLDTSDIDQITDAIKYHSMPPIAVKEYLRTLGVEGKLLEIIRDADVMDAFGAVGLLRAFSSKYYLKEYDDSNVKGDVWGLTIEEYREKFGEGLAPVYTLVDQVSQQIRSYDWLHTRTAKEMAKPFIQFMKDFVGQLEYEITFPTR